jgi:hypothetical protein
MTSQNGRSPELAVAAYRLAFGITGDEGHAVASLDAAARRSSDASDRFLDVVRDEARARRVHAPDPATAPRPTALAHVSLPDWAVLERVALRGMMVTEAAEAVGIDRREALRRLQRGLVATRDCLLEREASDDPQAVRRDVLGPDHAAGSLDDAARDRQAEPAALRSV